MRTLLQNATVITQNAKREILRGVDVVIENDKITFPTDSTNTNFDNVYDLSGKFLLPGFVQAHVHLCQTHLRNHGDDRELLPWLREVIWPGEAELTEETLYQTARLAVDELIEGGTTSVLTMETVKFTHSSIQAVIDGGIRAIVGKALMDRDAGQPTSLLEDTTAALQEADSLYDTYNDVANGRVKVCYAPRFVPTSSEKLLTGISARAKERNAIIHTHCSENRSEIALVKQLTGKDNLHYLDSIGLLSPRTCLAHCIHLGDNDITRLRDNGVHVLHCPSSNLKLGSGIAPIAELLLAGVSVALGADGAPCNNNLDGLHEARLMPMLQSIRVGVGKVTAQHALDALTINGAKALGLEKEIGSIEAGKKADLIVVNPNRPHSVGGDDPVSRLIYSCRADDVEMVWVDGIQLK